MSVLVVGSIALDHIKMPREEHSHLLGGSASYASVASSFFTPTRLVGVVGEDFPQKHKDLLQEKGVDIEGLEVVPGGKTFRWSGEYEENVNNRQTLSVELNVFEHFRPKLPTSWQNSPYVLLGNIAPSLQMEVWKQTQGAQFVVADTMDLWINMSRNDLEELLEKIDMLILNDSEATLLTEERNLIKAGKAILQKGLTYVAIKKGEHGCLLFGPDDQFFTVGAFPLEEIRDPTGAGDAFAGAFLGSLAAKKGDHSFEAIKESILYGTLVASFCVEEFSLRRFEKMSKADIDLRFEELSQYAGIASK